MTSNPEDNYNATRDTPFQRGLSVEHLEICRGCTQRAAAHSLDHKNDDPVLTDVEMMQVAEISKNNVQTSNKIMNEMIQEINELRTVVSELKNEKKEWLNQLKDKSKTKLEKYYKYGLFASPFVGFLAGILV